MADAQLTTKKALTLEAAKQIAAAAHAEAKKNNWTMVIAIVDALAPPRDAPLLGSGG